LSISIEQTHTQRGKPPKPYLFKTHPTTDRIADMVIKKFTCYEKIEIISREREREREKEKENEKEKEKENVRNNNGDKRCTNTVIFTETFGTFIKINEIISREKEKEKEKEKVRNNNGDRRCTNTVILFSII
jgi:hypothetical protein